MRLPNCLIFLFVLAFGPAGAQQARLDSLVNLEKTYRTADTTRAKLLTDLARRFYSIDPAQGLEYADKAIQLTEKLGDKKLLAGAYSAKGTNKMGLADYAPALDYYQRALVLNEQTGNKQGVANNYNNIGLVYQYIFDYPKALGFYQKTLAINEQTGNTTGITNALGNIANIQNELRDYPKAIEYYERAKAYSERTGNLQSLSGILVNLGNVYTQLADYPKALEYKQQALEISEKSGNKARIANNLSNIGNVYSQLADYPRALEYQQKALEINESIQDKSGIAANWAGIGKVYLYQKQYAAAAAFSSKARELAGSIGSLKTESEALQNLSLIYENTGRYDSAFAAFRQYILLRDSISNVEVQKEITKKTLQFEFSKTEDSLRQQQLITDAKLNEQILLATKRQQELILKQNALDLANKERALQRLAFLKTQADLQYENNVKAEQLARAENERKLQATQVNLQQAQLDLKDRELQTQKTQRFFFIAGLFLLALLSFFIFRNYKNQQKSNRIIQVEKQKSDDLLLNILPKEVADELKENGEAGARQYDNVTVLFTDFVDFTRVSETLSPQQLVGELHECFKAFDEIIERHGLEKIKTIGDAYMAVSGLPLPDKQHARQAARAAIDILEFIRRRQMHYPDGFQIRIGLSSGPVVAGIVGVKKFAYDIWGDTVNTASRMESGSEPGKINISGSTYLLLKNVFHCVYRGKIPAKNKGEVDMYFLGEVQEGLEH
ncbi:MAG: tetratricopeptide repeat protein [Lewinellaceae bacterium]|nr:tetratricopeptide repeat protein [Lewinellaceae bacterium]